MVQEITRNDSCFLFDVRQSTLVENESGFLGEHLLGHFVLFSCVFL